MEKKGFNLSEGRVIGNRYTVLQKLGSGTEGEVYKVCENLTKQIRAIKLYYPKKNPKFKTSIIYSNKLNKLKDCPIVLNYISHEVLNLRSEKVACLTCEFIEGELVSEFVEKQKGKRLDIFPALHLVYSLVVGLESIHLNGEYHGDLHIDNVIIKKFGLQFDIKILDFFHWGDSKKENRKEDIIKLINIFYEILGGQKRYKNLPPSIKNIICGQKRTLILQKFKTITQLRLHLENMDWSDAQR